MLTNLKALWLDESGQDLAEYALLLALIAIVVIVALRLLGPTIANLFNTIETELSTAAA
jgi:pilus assembly protein Flp/PilA